jgi:hypothetical protein
MERFSEETLKYLTACGWYPGRQIDISELEEALKKAEFKIFPAAQEFWREFGNLDYEWDCGKFTDFALFDLELIAEYQTMRGKVMDLSFSAGTALLPIGEDPWSIYKYYISPSGAIYSLDPGPDGRGKLNYCTDSADKFINYLPECMDAPWWAEWRAPFWVKRMKWFARTWKSARTTARYFMLPSVKF